MSAALETHYRQGHALEFWAIALAYSGGVLRLTTGGTVTFGGETYHPEDATYGTISRISKIVDGAGDQASSLDIEMLPRSSQGLEALASPALTGAPLTLYSGGVNAETGAVEGYETHFSGLVNFAPLTVNSDGWVLTLECVTEELRQREDDADKRLAPAHHRSVWPGEAGLDNITAVTRKIYWRASGPSTAVRYGGGGTGGGGVGPGPGVNVRQV